MALNEQYDDFEEFKGHWQDVETVNDLYDIIRLTEDEYVPQFLLPEWKAMRASFITFDNLMWDEK